MYDVGVDLYNKRNFRAAALQFELHAKAHPEDAKALYYAGLCYHQLSDNKKARLFYEQAVKTSPSSQAAQLARSMMSRLGSDSSLPAPATRPAVATVPMNALQKPSADFASLPADTRIYYTGDGSQMLVNVTINGRPREMIFDTGAPLVAIGKKQLQELGLPAPTGAPTGKTGGAANSAQVNYWETTADVKVGQILRKGLKLQVLEENPPFALLGQNFFQDFTYTIDAGSKSIHLIKRSHSQPQFAGTNAYTPKDPSVVPFTWEPHSKRIIVNVEVNGRNTDMILDTGNVSSTITFPSIDSLKKLNLRLPEDAKETTAAGVSGEGLAYEFQIARVRVGPIDRSNVDVKVNKEGTLERPIMGQSFWHGWEYTVDMDRKVVRFKRR